MDEKYKCGHWVTDHEIEPPYPCYECDCQQYQVPQIEEADDDKRD